MRKLFAFLAKYSVLILFIILEIISFSIIVNNDGYRQSVFFSSGNTVVASLYNINNTVVEYFYLKQANEGLAKENVDLQNELATLKLKLDTLTAYPAGAQASSCDPNLEVTYILAKVINNSTNKQLNYITLNKGFRDGVRKDMGVINEDGVVGVVSNVSEKFAVVIPILNPRIHINGKFVKNDYNGFVNWDGIDYRFAKLNDIARHVVFSTGDSLVTSGYTHSFPEGILIGTVDDFNIDESDAYFDIRVRLAVNFRTLSYVKLIDYLNHEERLNLEKETK
jgi:rod shape-determining protein MreC